MIPLLSNRGARHLERLGVKLRLPTAREKAEAEERSREALAEIKRLAAQESPRARPAASTSDARRYEEHSFVELAALFTEAPERYRALRTDFEARGGGKLGGPRVGG